MNLFKPHGLLLIRKCVRRMKGSKRKLVISQIFKKAANLEAYFLNRCFCSSLATPTFCNICLRHENLPRMKQMKVNFKIKSWFKPPRWDFLENFRAIHTRMSWKTYLATFLHVLTCNKTVRKPLPYFFGLFVFPLTFYEEEKNCEQAWKSDEISEWTDEKILHYMKSGHFQR